MEYYNGILCISHAELTDGIMSASLVRQLKFRGKIQQVRMGGNGREALFAVDSLPFKQKNEAYKKYPDFREVAASKPFVETIEPDGAAMAFFESFQLPDGSYLKTDKQQEYSNNAAILNAFRTVLEESDSEHIKGSKRCINRTDYWKRAASALPRISDRFPNSLPTNARRLQEKYNEYRRGGYAILVSGKYGTRNAARVDDDVKESILIQIMADARNLSDAQTARLYNMVAEAKGWKPITPATVRVWRRKYDLLTAGGRLGETRFRNQRSMQIKRDRPTAPLLYWTLDGWTAELLYQKTEERNGKTVTTYTNRLTLVLVLDPCVNYPVGYAIGDRETPELIKAALRNAVNHVAELFGRRYRVNQIQSDNYGRGALTPVYTVVGDKYTPARVHNAKAKVIEPFFNYFNRKYCQLCKNWSGFGITSNKDLQPNSEFLNKNRHDFPDAEGCRQMLTSFVEHERKEKQARYVEMFSQLPEERRLPLSDEQYLLTFGAETGYRNAIEGMGLRPTIGGIKRDYDCFDPRFREYAHVKWAVKYDPDNLDHVLAVNEDGSLRFMLEQKHIQPMALADRKEEDADQLKRVGDFNKRLESQLTAQLAKTREITEQFFNDNRQLDMATRLLLCDDKGRNKDYKETRRLQAGDADFIEIPEVRVVKSQTRKTEDDDLLSLY